MTDPAPFGAVWSEFHPPHGLRRQLRWLGARGVALHVAWRVDASAEVAEARAGLVRAAAAAGVELRPWLLLPEADGYWAGALNAEAFCAAARALLRDWPGPQTALLVDLEPAYERVMALDRAVRQRDVRAAWAAARTTPGGRAMRDAGVAYARLVDEVHARGWRARLTTLPFVLDGAARLLGLPYRTAEWDAVSVQAYRTMFADVVRVGPGLVHAYARAAVERFGERAGVDLGLVGEGVYPSGIYGEPGELAADVGAALAAGIRRENIHVYSLDGMVDRGTPDAWVEPPGGEPSRDLRAWTLRASLKVATRIWRGGRRAGTR